MTRTLEPEQGTASASAAPAEPAEARAERLRRRRRLLAWGSPFVVAALLVSAKLVGMNAFAQQAVWRYDAKDAAGVAGAAGGMGFADIIETHKSHFARGDAAVLAGDWARARSEFEEALRLTGPDDECTIRVNLVLTLEKLGDTAKSAGDAAGAAKLYDDGQAVVAAAGAGCFQQDSPQNQEQQGERLREANDRLQSKRGQTPSAAPVPQPQTGPAAPTTPTPGPTPAPTQSQTPEQKAQDQRLKDLQNKSDAGQQQRSDGQQRDDYLDSPPNDPVDRPW